MTLTPSARVSAGAMVLRYAPGVADTAGSQAIDGEMSDESPLSLEKAFG